jgi:hypothetical protein
MLAKRLYSLAKPNILFPMKNSKGAEKRLCPCAALPLTIEGKMLRTY